MRNSIEFFWWGVQVNLDESNTQALVNLLDNGGNAAAVLFVLDPELKSRVAIALAAALVKIGASVIKQVDQSGGGRGVTISHPWVGPVPGWVTAQ